MEMIKGFDKSLAEKASKNALENFVITAEKTFASNEDQKMFQEIISEDMMETKEMV